MNSNGNYPTIYHFEASRGFRVVWLCEELDLKYDLVFRPGDQFGSLMALQEVLPGMPMAPVMGYAGELIVESGAIIDILLALHGDGHLVPSKTSNDFLFHTQWMHFAEGTALARMTQRRLSAMAAGIDVDQAPRGYDAANRNDGFEPIGAAAVFEFVEAFLSKHPYFGGAEFTAADIMMEYAMRVAKLVVWDDTNRFPNIAAWRKNVMARPAYARAVKASTFGELDDVGVPLHAPHPFARPA
ncbi:glutathione S-transferase family protein [Novosphingobium colocasiae]|uniref:Glutathione S-transferase n=1 Tax=Novosphingobium colocasiae TaxID=1256513 RepID=A0A918PNC8_9SPHN|nr:glutathione S-transferase family protein [Novosphingobium colocasiae]GGZ14828.1 glutathione S-transferase [Novosphingobium colocasiae]